MAYVREQINGTSPQDIMKMNDNFMSMWEKTFGDINFSDASKELKSKISTQYIQVQDNGNLDKNYALRIRFYVPPTVQTVKSSNFNIFCENYRMDSSITSSSGSIVGGDIVLNVASGGGGSTSVSYEGSTSYVRAWGYNPEYSAPSVPLISNGDVTRNTGGYFTASGRNDLGVQPIFAKYSGTNIDLIDLYHIQHSHDIPPHSHSVSFGPHSHSGSAKIDIPGHSHGLSEGIKVSTTAPQNVNMYVNDNKVCTVSSTKPSENNMDISKYVKIGEWNTIKVDTSNLARVSVYGSIEVIMKYF